MDGCLQNDFQLYYHTTDVTSAWQHFFQNETVQAKLGGYWRTTARAFAGAAGVLGYDSLNEPLPGDFYSDLSLLLPGACARVLVRTCARACLLWPAERAAAR